MRASMFEARADELRRSITKSQESMDLAMAQLKDVSRRRIGIGRFMASHPWKWLLFAVGAGLFMGLHKRNR